MSMNWLEKIRFLISEQKKPDYHKCGYFIDLLYLGNNWTPAELDHLKTHYSHLPVSYVDFIEEFDIINIAWVTFYGSEANKCIPLIPEIAYWREEGLPEEFFPFGKGPAGGVYVFDHRGAVIEFPCDDYEFERPRWVAFSLEEFIDKVLLGKGYAQYNTIDKDTFYDFMKLQGWV